MNKKILSFITDGRKFLALRNNFKDTKHGGDFWFVVTGFLKNNESLGQAVKREIKEETNLEIMDMLDLNWCSIYKWLNEDCIEYNFIAFIRKGEVILNEEKIEYKWLSLKEFVKLIKWEDDKALLGHVLKKALKKEVYFKEKNIFDYRKLKES